MRKVLVLLCALMAMSAVVAHEVINGDEDEKLIVLSEIKVPMPNRLIDEPEAW